MAIAPHFPILAWVPLGHLPRDVGYVRLDSVKYTEWQVLAYAEARDKDLYKKEEKLYPTISCRTTRLHISNLNTPTRG
ncbi:hypothetical protein PHMEG_00032233 [Phytophthora megakarya]|uniref:Uncharacterized protein n=1 Tax=Phytophthora megakarya TaxID=4795 RepID=A0A225UW49_9STRA|nr:hypothetical protein PHMEG_00032233 [Phytophthora megakarya]